ncbi:TonB-dependent receptor [Sphingomonas adhaesiva]|uniref:TonB-dependent receptor n=1 Tax=Sphingomonas adhaesiva TaxID=28212 RepID=UPI002FFA78A5
MIAAIVALPAGAQVSAPPETEAPAGAVAVGAAVESHEGDILVTAQRRSERLQDVPIAITVVNAAALEEARVENIQNIQAISPSIQFRASNISSSSANVIIRGLGTTGTSRSFEGAVGIFIDGVYRTRAAAALTNFLDFDNLQVLRGPQGTLFGKNTSAGAVLLTSAAPSTDRVKGTYQIGYGNYENADLKGAINVPLADNLALRVAGLYMHDEGQIRDVKTGRDINGLDSHAIKASLLFEPSSDLSIRLIGDYAKSVGNCCYGTVDYINGPTQPLIDSLIRAAGRRVPSKDSAAREASLSNPTRQLTRDYGATVITDIGLGEGSIRSVTGLRWFEVGQENADSDFTGVDILNFDEAFTSKFFSQELTYTGRIDAIDTSVVVGGFYSHEKLTAGRTFRHGTQAQAFWNALLAGRGLPAGTASAPVGLFSREQMRGTGDSYAAFAHLEKNLTSEWSAILGARYSIEKKTGAFRRPFFTTRPNDPFRIIGQSPSPDYASELTNRALSGTVGVQYKPSRDAMLYLSYNRGFKAGGVNIDANAAGARANNPNEFPGATLLDPRFQPETVDAVELGGKFQYLDGRARSNFALFYNDISNLQVAQFLGLQFTVLNARSATVYGAEIENQFQVADGVNLSLDATWLPHAQYGDDPRLSANLRDQRFRYASKLTGNIGINADRPITSDLNITSRWQYQYIGSQFINTASDARRGDVHLVNGNFGVRSVGGWQLETWVLNLFDRTYPTTAFNTSLQTGDQNAYLAPPRTYGITLRSSF